jgi:hypothetical protein
MDSPARIVRLVATDPVPLRALLASEAAVTPALLVTPGPGREPDWTVGFAWLDLLAAGACGPDLADPAHSGPGAEPAVPSALAPEAAPVPPVRSLTGDGIGAEASLASAELIRRALEAWISGPGGPVRQEGLARLTAARLVRLAPLLADPAPWFRPEQVPGLAARLRDDVASVMAAGRRSDGPVATAELLLGACATVTALPGSLGADQSGALWQELARSFGALLDQGGLTPARLQRIVADLDLLAAAGGDTARGAVADLVPRLIHVLRLLTRTDDTAASMGADAIDPAAASTGTGIGTGIGTGTRTGPGARGPGICLAGFGSGPGDALLNEAFLASWMGTGATLDTGEQPEAVPADRPQGAFRPELRGTGCGYGRIDCAGTTVWLGLPPGAGGRAALEIATRDGLILTTGPKGAPFGRFQTAGASHDLRTPATGRRQRARLQSQLSLRVRESAETVIIETVSRHPAGTAIALRRIAIFRTDGSIEGHETFTLPAPQDTAAIDGILDDLPACLVQFFAPPNVQSSASRDGRSVIFRTNCGSAWRLRSKGLDFHCTSGFARVSQDAASGPTLVTGVGAGTGFRGLVELRWHLGRET